jgi:DNA repair protein RadC
MLQPYTNIARATRKRPATGFRLVREGAPPTNSLPAVTAIRNPRDVYEFMAPFAAQEPGEVFWLLPLDSQHKVHGGPVVVTRGLLNSSLVHPREVFLRAIVANAAAVVLCHNHPSGDPTPSPDDRAVTEQLVAAGKLLDIPVQDHVIIGDGRFLSFAEAGLL